MTGPHVGQEDGAGGGGGQASGLFQPSKGVALKPCPGPKVQRNGGSVCRTKTEGGGTKELGWPRAGTRTGLANVDCPRCRAA